MEVMEVEVVEVLVDVKIILTCSFLTNCPGVGNLGIFKLRDADSLFSLLCKVYKFLMRKSNLTNLVSVSKSFT